MSGSPVTAATSTAAAATGVVRQLPEGVLEELFAALAGGLRRVAA